MPETYTPVPAAPPATWTLPNNLELADAEGLKTNVLKKEADALALFVNSFAAIRNQRPPISVIGMDITIGAFSVYFPALGGFVSYAGSTYTLVGLANTTWYYIYAVQSGGVITAFNTSTTEPTADLQSKTGDPNSAYICCFRTNGAATPYPIRSENGRYLYVDSQDLIGPDAGNTNWTVISMFVMGTRVPPHGRTVEIQVTNTDTRLSNYVLIRPEGSSSATGCMQLNYSQASLRGAVPIRQGGSIEYKTAIAGGTTGLYISLLGFSEA